MTPYAAPAIDTVIATALAVGLVIIPIGIAVLIGLMLRPTRRPTSTTKNAPPPPPAGFRPRDARHHVPMFSTYDGAARLQRARRAASEFIAEIGATNEILPLDVSGVPRTGPRPFGPIDVDAMTRAIVEAWIGEEEPMVSVPIMKLGDIRVDRDEAAIKAAVDQIAARDKLTGDAAVSCLNQERERRGLPPLATGGMVEPGKPYIVGETPSEQTRPQADDQGDA